MDAARAVGPAAATPALALAEVDRRAPASDVAEAPFELGPAPSVILVVGVNGTGKTTTIAKLAWRLRQEGRSVVLAAADTFRAAAIEQLRIWGDQLGVPVVAQRAGADPGAVAFDAVAAAESRGIEAVIVDTAGRLQNKTQLMAELRKIRDVIARRLPGQPRHVLLVLDANTGQNGLAQAEAFSQRGWSDRHRADQAGRHRQGWRGSGRRRPARGYRSCSPASARRSISSLPSTPMPTWSGSSPNEAAGRLLVAADRAPA